MLSRLPRQDPPSLSLDELLERGRCQRRRRLLIGGGVATAAAALILLLALWTGSPEPPVHLDLNVVDVLEEEAVEVHGLEIRTADAFLTDNVRGVGLAFLQGCVGCTVTEVLSQVSADVIAGLAIGTDPEAGTGIDQESCGVVLVMSTGAGAQDPNAPAG